MDASLSVKEIAAPIPLSATPCWKRLQRLEPQGYIRARVALQDTQKINAAVTVFVAINTDHYTRVWIECFREAGADLPDVMRIHRMSGEVDYLLRVVVSNIVAYDQLKKVNRSNCIGQCHIQLRPETDQIHNGAASRGRDLKLLESGVIQSSWQSRIIRKQF